MGTGGSVIKKLAEGGVLNERVVYCCQYSKPIPLLDYLFERHIFRVGKNFTNCIYRTMK
jgi:predicted metal-binding transcription factor (methanogenesis marker protein 9)